jgi:hypothetical protein
MAEGHATREEVEHLRKQIAELKRTHLQHPVHHVTHAPPQQDFSQLVDSLDRLHGTLNKLVQIFEQANKEIYDEYDKGMHDEMAKLDQVLQQNEKMARGIVALADMMKQQQRPVPPPIPQPVVQPQVIPPQQAWEASQQAQQWKASEEQSFVAQPVITIPGMQAPEPRAPPAIPVAPVMPPPPQPAPPPVMASLPPLNAQWPPAEPQGSFLPPPPPPAPSQRKSLLEKFSFK